MLISNSGNSKWYDYDNYKHTSNNANHNKYTNHNTMITISK